MFEVNLIGQRDELLLCRMMCGGRSSSEISLADTRTFGVRLVFDDNTVEQYSIHAVEHEKTKSPGPLGGFSLPAGLGRLSGGSCDVYITDIEGPATARVVRSSFAPIAHYTLYRTLNSPIHNGVMTFHRGRESFSELWNVGDIVLHHGADQHTTVIVFISERFVCRFSGKTHTLPVPAIWLPTEVVQIYLLGAGSQRAGTVDVSFGLSRPPAVRSDIMDPD